jgi:NAD(P)-dependent dehydrogenase (short-subunit alcohol dehydrogenase family)
MPAGSAIVINGSMAASKGMPAFSVYAASKAALRSFARGWSVELKDRGIRVNVVVCENSAEARSLDKRRIRRNRRRLAASELGPNL